MTLRLFFVFLVSLSLFADEPCPTRRVIGEDGKLASVIDGRDVFATVTCAPEVAQAFDEALSRFEYAPVDDVAAASQRHNEAFTPPPCASDPCELYVRLDSLPENVRKDLRGRYRPSRAPAAASGGSPNIPERYILSLFVRHSNKRGHHELTAEGLDAYSATTTETFAPRAAAVLKDASRDADFFEWLNPSAHAQTRSKSTTGELVDPSLARIRFISWEKDQIAKALIACAANKPREALYWVGYALHGVQDLAFHNGISNAEHAWRDYGVKTRNDRERGIDTSYLFDHKWHLAKLGTEQFLTETRALFLRRGQAQCWQRMITADAAPLTEQEKVAIHRKSTDMSAAELTKYAALAALLDVRMRANNQRSFLVRRWLDDGGTAFDPERMAELVKSVFTP